MKIQAENDESDLEELFCFPEKQDQDSFYSYVQTDKYQEGHQILEIIRQALFSKYARKQLNQLLKQRKKNRSQKTSERR